MKAIKALTLRTLRPLQTPILPLTKLPTRLFAKQCTFVEFTDNDEFNEFLETGIQKKKVKRKLTEEEIEGYIKTLNIPETDLVIKYSRSSGPGGQHVNRTESKATVCFNIFKTSVFDENAKKVLIESLSSKMTKSGDLIVSCQETREQKRNLEIAMRNLKRMIAENVGSEVIEDIELLKEEEESRNLRMEFKKKRSDIKKMRSKKFDF